MLRPMPPGFTVRDDCRLVEVDKGDRVELGDLSSRHVG